MVNELLQIMKIEILKADVRKINEEILSPGFSKKNSNKSIKKIIGVPLSEFETNKKLENFSSFASAFEVGSRKIKKLEENLPRKNASKMVNISKKKLESLFFKKKRIIEIEAKKVWQFPNFETT